MTPNELLLAQALRMCNMNLTGSGLRKLLPPELNQGVRFNFNGYESIGEYTAHLNEILDAVKRELVETRGLWSIEVAVELADLERALKHRSTAELHELMFTGNWRIVEREPEVLDEVKAKAGLFFAAQASTFERWEAMRERIGQVTTIGLKTENVLGSESSASQGKSFEWKGTVTDAVELALALDASGYLLFSVQTSQQERIKEIVGKLGGVVPHLDQTLNQLMNRKAGPVKAIDRMRGALLAHQELRDRP
jgi:hypothetical protein